jgi:LAS seventeen-binding protein 1/2
MKPRSCSRQADTSQQNGAPSQYIDPRYNPNPQQQFNPGAMAQQAQDPNHPANPGNPKVLISRFTSVSSSFWPMSRGSEFSGKLTIHQHHEWVKNMASKFGNAAMFGAGATFGGDMVNDVLKQF